MSEERSNLPPLNNPPVQQSQSPQHSSVSPPVSPKHARIRGSHQNRNSNSRKRHARPTDKVEEGVLMVDPANGALKYTPSEEIAQINADSDISGKRKKGPNYDSETADQVVKNNASMNFSSASADLFDSSKHPKERVCEMERKLAEAHENTTDSDFHFENEKVETNENLEKPLNRENFPSEPAGSRTNSDASFLRYGRVSQLSTDTEPFFAHRKLTRVLDDGTVELINGPSSKRSPGSPRSPKKRSASPKRKRSSSPKRKAVKRQAFTVEAETTIDEQEEDGILMIEPAHGVLKIELSETDELLQMEPDSDIAELRRKNMKYEGMDSEVIVGMVRHNAEMNYSSSTIAAFDSDDLSAKSAIERETELAEAYERRRRHEEEEEALEREKQNHVELDEDPHVVERNLEQQSEQKSDVKNESDKKENKKEELNDNSYDYSYSNNSESYSDDVVTKVMNQGEKLINAVTNLLESASESIKQQVQQRQQAPPQQQEVQQQEDQQQQEEVQSKEVETNEIKEPAEYLKWWETNGEEEQEPEKEREIKEKGEEENETKAPVIKEPESPRQESAQGNESQRSLSSSPRHHHHSHHSSKNSDASSSVSRTSRTSRTSHTSHTSHRSHQSHHSHASHQSRHSKQSDHSHHSTHSRHSTHSHRSRHGHGSHHSSRASSGASNLSNQKTWQEPHNIDENQ